MSVIWIVTMTYYEPHGRRKRSKLEVRDNDGGVSIQYGLTLAEVREIATLNGLEKMASYTEYVTTWELSTT